MKKYGFLLLVICGLALNSKAQIGYGTNNPDPRAVIELSSSDKAFYLPRLTTAQLDGQIGWKEGMMVYNTDSNCVFFRGLTAWECLTFGASFELVDDDEDTKIQVEEGGPGTDDDIIRFDVDGTEGMTLVPKIPTNFVETLSTTPFAAYSLRKAVSSYTGPAIRVRRSSDDTEQDINFTTANELDTAALTTFVGAGNDGFVTIWYDQAGSNNMIQPTAANQPRIVIGGTLQTVDNGLPAIDFASADFLYRTTSDALLSSPSISSLVIGEYNSTGTWMILHGSWDSYLGGAKRKQFSFKNVGTNAVTLWTNGANRGSGGSVTQGATTAIGYAAGASGSFVSVNGTQTSITDSVLPTNAGNHLTFGDYRATGYFVGKQSEALFYTSVLSSSDYTAIEDNQEQYWTNASPNYITPVPSVEAIVYGDAQVTGILYDSDKDAGTAGQVLTTTALGTNWVDASNIAQEPWFTAGTTDGHTSNTGDMFFSGNIGVGTSTLNAGKVASFAGDVDIQGVLDPTKIILSGDGSVGSFNPTTDNQYEIEFQDGRDLEIKSNNTNNIMHIENAGNIGVGTNAPTVKLDVNGAGFFRNGGLSTNYTNNQLLFGYNGTANYKNAIRSRHNGGNDLLNTIDFYTWDAGTDDQDGNPTLHGMTVTAGRLGVSTTAPQTFLHVNNTIPSDETTVGVSPIVRLSKLGASGAKYSQNVEFRLGSYEASLAARTRMDITMGLGNTNTVDKTPMTIRADGRVGINERHTPEYNLDVNGTFRNTGAGLFSVMGGSDDMTATPARGIRMWLWNNTGWGIYMSQSGDGRAMDGGTAPSRGSVSSYAVRFRAASDYQRGFMFENDANVGLLSIRGNDGMINNKRLDDHDEAANMNGGMVVSDKNGNILGASGLFRVASGPLLNNGVEVDAGPIYNAAELKGYARGGGCSVNYNLTFHIRYRAGVGFSSIENSGTAGSAWTFGGTGTATDPYTATSAILRAGNCAGGAPRLKFTASAGRLTYTSPSGPGGTSAGAGFLERLLIETY